MTYTFKLARRLAISRHFAMLPVLLLFAGCTGGDATSPDNSPVDVPGSGIYAWRPRESAPVALLVSPSSVIVETNQLLQFRARGRNRAGDEVVAPVTWSTTGGTILPDGRFSAASVGTYQVAGSTRTSDGSDVAQTSSITVVRRQAKLKSVVVTPSSATLNPGVSQTFAAIGRLAGGDTVPIGVTWSAKGGTIDAGGLYVAGDTVGTFRVIAIKNAGTLADTATITITAPPSPPPPSDSVITPVPPIIPIEPAPPPLPVLAQVTLLPASVTLAPGTTKQFSAYGRTTTGDSTAVNVVFTATGGTITTNGLYTAGSTAGTFRVIATADALSDTSTVSVTVPLGSGTRSLAAGFWNYWNSGYCNSAGMTASAQAISTSDLLGFLQAARKCNVRLALVPTRMFLTTTGVKGSPFSPDSAKAFTDRMAKVLVPDTLRKYDPWIIGFNLADDYGCAPCWGGVPVTPAQIETWARYVRTKIPGLRLGVRADPTAFVAKSTTLQSAIDYAWAQYHTGKGDAKTYFDKQASVAKSQGLAVAMGLNLTHCDGSAGGITCTPAQVRTFLGLAAQYPDNCALLGWTYSSTTLEQPGMTDAWAYVVKLAAQHPDVPCKHR